MANLKDIRDRIKSVRSIQKVTKAMKMVAAAKMRRAQERMEQARPYTNRLVDVIHHLLPDVDRSLLPLLDIRPIQRVGYVIVASDRGLAGSFNTNVFKNVEIEINQIGKDNVDLLSSELILKSFIKPSFLSISAIFDLKLEDGKSTFL